MNRLKELRIKHDKTQREIADLLNVTPKAISFYELGQREIPNESLKILANFFSVTTDVLLGREPSNVELIKLQETNRVPIIGTVRCGAGGLAYEYIDEYIAIDERYRPDEVIAFRAAGDSMEGDEIHEGDICLVHLQEEVPDGAIAVVVIDGEEGTMKHVHTNNGVIVLQASNPAYAPRVFTGEDTRRVRIVGRVVEVRHRTV